MFVYSKCHIMVSAPWTNVVHIKKVKQWLELVAGIRSLYPTEFFGLISQLWYMLAVLLTCVHT